MYIFSVGMRYLGADVPRDIWSRKNYAGHFVP